MLIPPHYVSLVEQAIYSLGTAFSEFELIQYLDEKHPEEFSKPNFQDPLLLFQHHFILRHILYDLQQRWFHSKKPKFIKIELVNISWQPVIKDQGQTLDQFDHLREYYLDLTNLDKENKDSIQKKLNNFWQRYKKVDLNEEALLTLGLQKEDFNISSEKIKQQYQRLAGIHHPDKGGDAKEFQKIRWAYETLK